MRMQERIFICFRFHTSYNNDDDDDDDDDGDDDVVVVMVVVMITKMRHSLPQLLTGCPNGWIAYEGSCYLFNNKDMMSFAVAEVTRQIYLIISVKLWWIGIQDMVDGDWRYTSDDSRVTFFDWEPSQPDEGSNADCGVLWANKDYKWGDHRCVDVGSYKVYAICEAR
ncbi:PLCL-like protein [Mya arenaria]|uniref:PLCL-like protein n=1 Tax=Mya arenaria TaxID=6604 RepID=A0ABY7E5P0_MYAAR|nr:PLCL-like protein [Mya arenaria]